MAKIKLFQALVRKETIELLDASKLNKVYPPRWFIIHTWALFYQRWKPVVDRAEKAAKEKRGADNAEV